MSRLQQTIVNFGDQWTRFTDNSGYYGSKELLKDILHPFLDCADIAGRCVAEIGSGTGRIVSMLLEAGAAHVAAIEPSRAFEVLARRFANMSERVCCQNLSGEAIAGLGPFDLVLSIGVLHHIPDPSSVVEATMQALRPGGRFLVWVYGREGNAAYLWFVQPVRALTIHLPDLVLHLIVRLLDIPLAAYIGLCRFISLPMRNYMRHVLGRMAPDKRRLVIFDQLNPAYAKYYTQREAMELLSRTGFVDIRTHHRHGYSWTVIGRKPEESRMHNGVLGLIVTSN
jgi:SAM-dependent methyltransferase